MSASKRRESAVADMLGGGLLYIYVHNEHARPEIRQPTPGSGAIVGDRGLVRVSRRIARHIQQLGTEWCDRNRALVLSDWGKAQARGGALWFW